MAGVVNTLVFHDNGAVEGLKTQTVWSLLQI